MFEIQSSEFFKVYFYFHLTLGIHNRDLALGGNPTKIRARISNWHLGLSETELGFTVNGAWEGC